MCAKAKVARPSGFHGPVALRFKMATAASSPTQGRSAAGAYLVQQLFTSHHITARYGPRRLTKVTFTHSLTTTTTTTNHCGTHAPCSGDCENYATQPRLCCSYLTLHRHSKIYALPGNNYIPLFYACAHSTFSIGPRKIHCAVKVVTVTC